MVCIGFVMFRAGSVMQGLQIIGAMFTGFNFTAAGTVELFRLLNAQTLLMMAAGLCLSCNDGWTIVKFLLTALFIWLTSPTGGHLIARLEITVNEHPETEMEMIEK